MDLDFTVTDEWQGLSKQEQYDLSLHTLVDHMAINPTI